MPDTNTNVIAKIEFARINQATELNLARSGLKHLPEAIGELTKLETLILSHNELAELPSTILNLTQLKHLDVSHNQLTTLPQAIGRMENLTNLHLVANRLKRIPHSIGELIHLRKLDLNGNYLTRLPESIARLQQLETLYLANNRLSEIPSSLRKLTELVHLDLEGNAVGALPAWISELKYLTTLDLTKTQLSDLPDSLRDIQTLEKLYLHENYLGLPPEVLGPPWQEVSIYDREPADPKEILHYYFRIRGGKRPLNEAKLILVGRGGVGKTSLVNRLVYNQFFLGEKKTEGIQITDWSIQLLAGENVRLNVWDFGGQEIMHATHQFFLTQRSLYLLVLNGREGGEDADAEYWLKLIDSFGDDSPVIVVMNKIREHPFDLNRRALQQKYPIRAFVKTDCGNEDGSDIGFGIQELREAIYHETDNLEHLRDAFPTSWFSIKDRLATMEKNYLSFEEFQGFCLKHGESDPRAQEALAGYLHNLGIALNYRDDPRLQDTHVLNPHWVTNGIYKILNSDKLAKQKGEIWLRDLKGILDTTEYPAGMRRFIFDLMKKFDLCFSFPDDDSRYLVPELLDKQEPAQTMEFQPDECLNFQYYYPVLPEGLLPRFIVRTHILSEGLPRWRTGVILQFDGNRALVKADVHDRRVTISVSGPLSSRRRLLAIIRSDLERIHSDIKNLQPQEMVPLPGFPSFAVPYKKLMVMEEQGVREFLEVIENAVHTLIISALLNGVDLEGTRERQKPAWHQRRPIRVVYSYSHRDENLRNELETHLKLLQRQGRIDTWSDRRIDAGDEWKQRISDNFEAADIVLLLVSADFLASDYCFEIEMRRALERHERGEARVIPVIVRDVHWADAPFAKLQALPKGGLAVTKWPDKDSAWRNVSEGIQKVIETLPQYHQRRGVKST
jgi:internalin A